VPLLLCWGEQDPWIRPLAADKIQALFPAAKRVSINAGHCPHDEAPEAVNSAIADWMKSLA
jgi:pimeloyl-ACP methyl ester carboxylesterase